MGQNGVSHHVVHDDLDGARTLLLLLSFAPVEMSGALAPSLASSDPAGRDVGYSPGAGEKLDPRAAIDGTRADWRYVCIDFHRLVVHHSPMVRLWSDFHQ